MSYIFSHTALYDGQFSILHLAIILISAAVIAYCSVKLSALKKKKRALEEAAAAVRTAEAVTEEDKLS